MTLAITQGHRVVGKLELARSCCRKVALSNSMFAMVDYLKEMTSKKYCCKYSEYGVLKHFLFFLDLV